MARNSSGHASTTFTVSLLIVSYVLSNFDRQIVSVLANDIKADFALSDSQLGALQGFTFAAMYAVAGVPMARMIDGMSRVRLAAAFVGIWSVMTALCGVARDFFQLLVYRAGVACAEAGLPTASLSLFADILDRRRLPAVSALLLTAPYVGGGLALLIGGWLLDQAHEIVARGAWPFETLAAWHIVFLAAGLPGLGLALLMWLTLREPPRRQIATRELADEAVPPTSAIIRQLFLRQRSFWLPFMLAVPFVVLTLFAQLAWMPAMLMREHGLSPSAAGVLVGPAVLVLGVSGSLLAGYLISRHGDDSVVAYCFSLMAKVIYAAAPLSLLYLISDSLATTVIAYASQFLLLAIFTATWPLAIQLFVQNRIRARTIALINLIGALLGQGMGPFVVGVINDQVWSAERLQLAIGSTVSVSLGVAAIAMTLAMRKIAVLATSATER